MSLTRFQEILVRALESVPYGEITSFKLIAEALGDPIA
ncbi:MAG: cysteine methyltransferase, partial [Thermoproteota archaeon]